MATDTKKIAEIKAKKEAEKLEKAETEAIQKLYKDKEQINNSNTIRLQFLRIIIELKGQNEYQKSI